VFCDLSKAVAAALLLLMSRGAFAGSEVYAQPSAGAERQSRTKAVSARIDPWTIFAERPSTDAPQPPESPPSAKEYVVTRVRSIVLNGKPIVYRATAGTLTLRENDGRPAASIFYTAYTVAVGNGAKRPVTFLFNGGPGASTMFLLMGSVGPIKADVPPPTLATGRPYRLNPDSILDRTDLVFIDAVDTGYSRILPGIDPRRFHGVDNDIEGFGRAIERYVVKFHRRASPKFLAGESYGTIRAAGLAYALHKRGMPITGVILVSSVLRLSEHASDLRHIRFLPSYTAAAWYHKKLAGQQDLAVSVEQAKEFTSGDYAKALQQDLPPEEKGAVGKEQSRLIGLPLEQILASELRVEAHDFMMSLLRDRALVIGRLDARYTTPDTGEAGGPADPSATAVETKFIPAINHYFSKDLRLRPGLNYRPGYNVRPLWLNRWGHNSPEGFQETVDTSIDLAAAMRENHQLKVLSVSGVYDLATPFFGTDRDLASLRIPDELKRNVTYSYFQSGHMVYIEPASARLLTNVLGKFYDGALKQ